MCTIAGRHVALGVIWYFALNMAQKDTNGNGKKNQNLIVLLGTIVKKLFS